MHSEIDELVGRLTKVQVMDNRGGNKAKKVANNVEQRACSESDIGKRERLLRQSLLHLKNAENDLAVSKTMKDAKKTLRELHSKLLANKVKARSFEQITDAFAEVLK